MLKKFLLLIAIVISLDASARARSAPLMDPPALTVPDTVSSSTLEKAIVGSGLRRGWQVVDRQPGVITLRYSPRGFSVTVKVTYDSKTVNIKYADSYDMEYGIENGGPVIHPNYNRWVNNLAHDIEGEMTLGSIK